MNKLDCLNLRRKGWNVMFELMENDKAVVFKTKYGRFIFSTENYEMYENSCNPNSPNDLEITVSYQSVGNPIRKLVLFTHARRNERGMGRPRTIIFEDPKKFEDSFHSKHIEEQIEFIHDLPQSEELTQFEEVIEKAKSTYNGIDLEVHYKGDGETYKLCYVGNNDYRYTIQEFKFSEISPIDIEYCTIHHGLDYIVNN